MTGAAGTYAAILGELIEAPAQFLFMSYLTCLGSVLSPTLRLKSVLPCQPRSYTLLLGPSGISRKSTAASHAVELFCETVSGFKVVWGVGSAEGLDRILKPTEEGGAACALLCFDEMKGFISKCGIDSSVLLPAVNTLFESNRFESHIKKSSIKLEKAHLSLLAATTIATYERMYTPAFLDIGFVNRVFIVPGAGERKNPIPPELPAADLIYLKTDLREVLQHVGAGLSLTLTPEAEERYNSWYFALERSPHATRLDTYSRRFMVLLAANSLKRSIDLETVEQALTLCDWQLKMRSLYDPIKADSRFAEMEEKIRRVLKARGECTAVELRRFTNARGFGLSSLKRPLKTLRKPMRLSKSREKSDTGRGAQKKGSRKR